jgi:hypothetical protein
MPTETRTFGIVSASNAAQLELENESSSLPTADRDRLVSVFRHVPAILESDWLSLVIESNPSRYAQQKRKLAAAEEAFFGWLVNHLLPALKAG